MNIVPILNPIAERYLYLPSIGLITTFAMLVIYLLNKSKQVGYYLAIVIAIALMSLTINGNGVWKNEYTLWRDTLQKSPENANAHKQMGLVYARKNRLKEAYEHYMVALKFAPNNQCFKGEIHNNLGLLYITKGQYIKAREELKIAIKLDPLNFKAHKNLGILYFKDFEYDKALVELNAALKLNPSDDAVYYYLGSVYVKTNQRDEAYSAYIKAMELNSKNAAAYFSLGELLVDSNLRMSIEMVKRGLALSPNDIWAHSFLGDLYTKRKMEIKNWPEQNITMP